MESFRWDEHFITGLKAIDEQHHHLVDIFNQFGGHLAKDEIVYADIKELFRELFDYADYHFKEEEKLMSQVGVDRRHLEEHIEEHAYFLDEVTSMHAYIKPGNLHTTTNMLDFLTRWLAYHILGSDQNMARQIVAIQAGTSPETAYSNEEQRIAESTEPLVVALTGLFHQLKSRNKELAQLNRSLEEKVEERTEALLKTNLQLEKLSITDVLTGLPNRRHAMQQLAEHWNESVVSGNPLACIMIDADHFKVINDTYGHAAGDAVLQELAKTIRSTVAGEDILCRLGGDEFLVICPDQDREDGLKKAQRVLEHVSRLRVKTDGGFWYGSISAGVADRTAGMKDHEDLIKAADNSVYEAKRDGRNCVRAISAS